MKILIAMAGYSCSCLHPVHRCRPPTSRHLGTARVRHKNKIKTGNTRYKPYIETFRSRRCMSPSYDPPLYFHQMVPTGNKLNLAKSELLVCTREIDDEPTQNNVTRSVPIVRVLEQITPAFSGPIFPVHSVTVWRYERTLGFVRSTRRLSS